MNTRPVEFVAARRPGRGAWLLAAVLLVAGALAWVMAMQWRAETRLLQQRTQSAAADAMKPVAPAPVYAPPKYAQSAHEMLAEARTDWSATLQAMERVARPGVTPLSTEFTAKGRLYRAELEFTDYALLLAYRAALDEGNPQPEWVLETAQSQSASGTQNRAVLRRVW